MSILMGVVIVAVALGVAVTLVQRSSAVWAALRRSRAHRAWFSVVDRLNRVHPVVAAVTVVVVGVTATFVALTIAGEGLAALEPGSTSRSSSGSRSVRSRGGATSGGS